MQLEIRFSNTAMTVEKKRGKLEYEDLAKIAREQGMSLGEVRKIVKNNQ